MTTNVRELTLDEIEKVSGGWVFVVPVALNLIARFATHQLAQHMIKSGGLVFGTYQGAQAYVNSQKSPKGK